VFDVKLKRKNARKERKSTLTEEEAQKIPKILSFFSN